MKLRGFSPPGHGLTSSGPSPPRRRLPAVAASSAEHRGCGWERSAAAPGHSRPRGQSQEKGLEEEGTTSREDLGAGGDGAPTGDPSWLSAHRGSLGSAHPCKAQRNVEASGAGEPGGHQGGQHPGLEQREQPRRRVAGVFTLRSCQGGLGCVRMSGTSAGINSGSSLPICPREPVGLSPGTELCTEPSFQVRLIIEPRPADPPEAHG